jgi:hypothetical protein
VFEHRPPPQHRIRPSPGRSPPTGGSANFVVVLRARDGRIVHWREYQDRAAIAEALA